MSREPRRQYMGGLFSPPVFNCVNDPYDEKKRSRAMTAHGMSEGKSQFHIGKELPSKFIRAFEGDGYKTLSKIQSEERMKGKAKFMQSSGFRFSSPSKKDSCPGAFDGTFRKKPIPYVPPVLEPKGRREKIEPVIQPQVTTRPMKMPSGTAAVTPNVLFSPYVYEPSPYDAAKELEKKRMEEARALEEGRPAFKVAAAVQVKPLPPSPIVARLQSPSTAHRHRDGLIRDSLSVMSDSSPPPNDKAEGDKVGSPTGAGTNGRFSPDKPFMPPHTLRSGAAYSTFSPYPPHADDPFDDKKIRNAVNSDRLLPLHVQAERLPSLLGTRRAWTPSSPAKEMFTKSLEAIPLSLSHSLTD